MRFWSPAQGPSIRRRSAALFVLLSPLLSPAVLRAQSVAEAARQEQARKAAENKDAPHVYTEEDLKRNKILTPEDQARVEARKKQQSPTPGQQNAESQPVDPSEQAESLGEIARRYRREREAQEADEAARKHLTPFSYEVPNQSVASPKSDELSVTGSSLGLDRPERPSVPVLPPGIWPHAKGPRTRISPFEPRPLVISPSPANAAPGTPAVPLRGEHLAPLVAPPPPGMIGVRPLRLKRGDSWWKLAARYLGNGTRWQELRGLNPEIKDPPELLRPGSIIQVPEALNLRTEKPQKHIMVKKGDTLWVLARIHLGQASAWGCLASANPQITNYTHLVIGSVLLLPGSSSPLCQSPMGHRREP